MLDKGTILKTALGRSLEIDRPLGGGGEGTAYLCKDLKNGDPGVLKVFTERMDLRKREQRIKHLVKENLCRICPVLLGPIDWVRTKDVLGHYTPFTSRVPLAYYLEKPDNTLLERIQMALAVAHAVEALHRAGISHGDLHSGNMLVYRQDSVLFVFIIDMDNFGASGLPLPLMLGHPHYMSPQLRAAMMGGKDCRPDIYADRFSLAVVLHEVLLWKHVASGFDSSEAEFNRAMTRWLHDPLRAEKPSRDPGGYPAEILNSRLAGLFRASLGLGPRERPSAEDWESALWDILQNSEVLLCPRCGDCCVFESTRNVCPVCRQPYPSLCLRTSKGKRIFVNGGATVIGRADLGGAMTVSAKHAVLQRIGPEMWLEPQGMNGTYRWAGMKWFRLTDGQPVPLSANDRLSFADQVAVVEEAA